MEKDFGVNFNCSYVESNGDKDLGVNIETSDGLNLNTQVNGKDLNKMVNDAYQNLLKDFYNYKLETSKSEEENDAEENPIEEKNDDYINELESYKIDNAILYDRLNKLEKEFIKLKEENKNLKKINVDKNEKKKYNNTIRYDMNKEDYYTLWNDLLKRFI